MMMKRVCNGTNFLVMPFLALCVERRRGGKNGEKEHNGNSNNIRSARKIISRISVGPYYYYLYY
jgi:hypothetical protein